MIGVKGIVTPASGWIPGLYDVKLDDGCDLRDLTTGQLRHLAWQGIELVPAGMPQPSMS